jgi:hypothetical protein
VRAGGGAFLPRFLAALAAGGALAIAAGDATAADGDGAYGRLDGDLELRLGGGAAIGRGGPSMEIGAGALYLGTAGLYGLYTDSFGGVGAGATRTVAAGVRLQPLFLGRYASNLEQGPARLDLLLDTLGFEIGAWWGWGGVPAASLPGTAGLELGVGVALPILRRATGPFLTVRGALRVQPAGTGTPAGGDESGLLSVTLAWHQVVAAHLADAGDHAR